MITEGKMRHGEEVVLLHNDGSSTQHFVAEYFSACAASRSRATNPTQAGSSAEEILPSALPTLRGRRTALSGSPNSSNAIAELHGTLRIGPFEIHDLLRLLPSASGKPPDPVI
jgi:hypothetical protein